RGRGPEQGPDQPGRGGDLRGGGGEPHPVPPGRARRGLRAGARSRARRAHVRVRDPAPGGHADPAGSGGGPHRAGDRPAQAARAAGGRRELPAVSDWQGLQEGSGGHGGERGGPMRRVDLHAYPGTAEWIASQGPYVEPLGRYWKREWTARTEE